jgi:hypothetical protein
MWESYRAWVTMVNLRPLGIGERAYSGARAHRRGRDWVICVRACVRGLAMRSAWEERASCAELSTFCRRERAFFYGRSEDNELSRQVLRELRWVFATPACVATACPEGAVLTGPSVSLSSCLDSVCCTASFSKAHFTLGVEAKGRGKGNVAILLVESLTPTRIT